MPRYDIKPRYDDNPLFQCIVSDKRVKVLITSPHPYWIEVTWAAIEFYVYGKHNDNEKRWLKTSAIWRRVKEAWEDCRKRNELG